MLDAVMASIGFNEFALRDDKRLYEAAALQLMNFFRSGMTSPDVLKTEMLFNYGMQKHQRLLPQTPLPRYATQGLPPARRAPHS